MINDMKQHFKFPIKTTFIYLFQVTTIIWNFLNKLLQTIHNKMTFNIKCYFLISFASKIIFSFRSEWR